jgi:23S rRNA G2445 N2-methylase RlmL
MKSGEKNRDKELYKELRAFTPEQLWDTEVPRFDRGTPEERIKRVSVIRAVGVVFSESGTEAQKNAARAWLHGLLQDPAEKIRRYAMAAIPKIGAGPKDEAELLTLLRSTTAERERKFLGQTLNKIGGSATLEVLQQSGASPTGTEQKVRANVARAESPSAIRLDRPLTDFAGLRIHLRGRTGLEEIVRDEVQEVAGAKFRIVDTRPGLVAIAPTAPFSLRDVYALRCFGTAGLVLGEVDARAGANSAGAYAAAITSLFAREVFETFTEGAIRYRLEFVAKGHQRGAVRQIVDRAYALEPAILNDARNAPWAIDVHPGVAERNTVELRPRLSPDPRLAFRRQDVPAASHPPLAACMARLGRQAGDEIVWDPFCGSGLELIERGLLGGARAVYGTDRSEEAIAIAEANFAAAKPPGVAARFLCCDFRDFAKVSGLPPNSVSLILTNPPMGMRVPIPNLRQLIADLFVYAAAMLKTGGRLVFANPLRTEPSDRRLTLESRRTVDLGGFDCRLEVYRKARA